MSQPADGQSTASQGPDPAVDAGSAAARGYATPRCGARARSGDPCRNPAGYKTDHVGSGRCAFHLGSTPNGRMAAAREVAAREAARIGGEVEMEPHAALELCVRMAAADMLALARRLDALADEDVIEGDQIHPLARALRDSRAQLASISKTAIDAGVDERRLQLDKLMVQGLFDILRVAMAKAQLAPEQEQRLREAMASELRAGLEPPVVDGVAR